MDEQLTDGVLRGLKSLDALEGMTETEIGGTIFHGEMLIYYPIMARALRSAYGMKCVCETVANPCEPCLWKDKVDFEFKEIRGN